jgi:hypothetical protein
VIQMSKFIAAIVAAVALLGAAKVEGCESVAIVGHQAYSAAFVAPVVAPVVYQPQVLAVEVANYAVASPVVVQQIRVRQRRQPVKAFVQAVTPPRRRCH